MTNNMATIASKCCWLWDWQVPLFHCFVELPVVSGCFRLTIPGRVKGKRCRLIGMMAHLRFHLETLFFKLILLSWLLFLTLILLWLWWWLLLRWLLVVVSNTLSHELFSNLHLVLSTSYSYCSLLVVASLTSWRYYLCTTHLNTTIINEVIHHT